MRFFNNTKDRDPDPAPKPEPVKTYEVWSAAEIADLLSQEYVLLSEETIREWAQVERVERLNALRAQKKCWTRDHKIDLILDEMGN